VRGQALPKPALRPYLATDTPVLAAIFVAAIEEWPARNIAQPSSRHGPAAADDEEQFGQRLGGALTLGCDAAELRPVGFAALKGADHIDMLYVHPRRRAGRGVDAVRGAWRSSPAGRGRQKASGRCQRQCAAVFCQARICRQTAQQRHRQRWNGLPTPPCRRRWPRAQRREFRT